MISRVMASVVAGLAVTKPTRSKQPKLDTRQGLSLAMFHAEKAAWAAIATQPKNLKK